MSRRKKGKVEEPLSKWPELEIVPDIQCVRLKGKYTAPSGWWQVGFPVTVLMLTPILLPASCSAVNGGNLDGMTGEFALGYTLLYVVTAFVIVLLAEYFGRRRRLKVIVGPEHIGIRGWTYNRAEGLNQFEIDEHEHAFQEEEAAHSGGSQSRIYRDAMQVVMRYGEKRVPVADFRRNDKRKAEALLLRLQTLAEPKGLEQFLGMAESPGQEAPAEQDDFGPARPIR